MDARISTAKSAPAPRIASGEQNARNRALLRDRTIVVTGAAGSIGKTLVHAIVDFDPREVRLVDNNETELFFLEEGLSKRPGKALLGDVRERDMLFSAFKGADLVFHLAALKHVPLCERSPIEAVQTNILGVQNVIAAAVDARVPQVVCTSSDKAVNPTSVMGASKLMGERLVNAGSIARNDGQIFVSTRFGNVLGSRGSVVPIFREQIRRGGPVTLTDPEMTRFIMTPTGAVDLVLESAVLAHGGEVFITKMRAVRIIDLAQAMIAELAPEVGIDPRKIEIKVVGSRPGEKLYEELMTTEETRRSIEFDRHFAVLPALSDLYGETDKSYPGVVSREVKQPYTSEYAPLMSIEETRNYLSTSGILDESSER